METNIQFAEKQELRTEKFERINLFFEWADREPGESHITWEQWNKLRRLRIKNENERNKKLENFEYPSEEIEEEDPKLKLIEKLEDFDLRTIIEAYNNRTKFKFYWWHGKSSGGVSLGGESYDPYDILFMIDYITLNNSVYKNGYYKTYSTFKEKTNRKGNKCGEIMIQSKDKKKGSFQRNQKVHFVGKKDRKNGQKSPKLKNY